MAKYSESVMQKVRQTMDLEFDDKSQDHIIEAMSKDDVFSLVLQWEGIIGYASRIKGWVSSIYKVNL